MKSDKGITLIALVITIIVLLILAGIALNVILGENGILNKAKIAKEKHEIAEIKEKVEMELANIEIERLDKEPLTIEEALQEMVERKIFESIDKAEQIGNIGDYVVKLKYDENNKIVIEYIEKATGVRITYELDPVGYTNKAEVDIILKIKGEISKITNPDGSIIEGKDIKDEIKHRVTSNGTYKFIIEYKEGQIKEKEIKVDTIDMLKPKEFEITAKSEKGKLVINAETEDSESDETSVKSGIEKYEYFVKLASESEYTKYETNEIENLAYGTYKIYVIAYDKANNYIQSKNETEVQIEEWIEIWNEEDLIDVAKDLTKNYIIMTDIELTKEWKAIGDDNEHPFSGKLEGNNYKITGLEINESTKNYQALFGYTNSYAKISNLSVECNITGGSYTAGLVGSNSGTIENVKVSGEIKTNSSYAGGLVGSNYGTIKNTYSTAKVTSSNASDAGGLVGVNVGTISKSVSSGNIEGNSNVGGLVGRNLGTITDAYSTGEAKGTYCIGGLVGQNEKGTITNTYTISKVIAPTGSNIYAGGLIGKSNGGSITNSYWATETAGVSTSWGGTLLTEEKMKQQSSYENWDFTSGEVWRMNIYPELLLNLKK